jgi:chromate transport protein ChrA
MKWTRPLSLALVALVALLVLQAAVEFGRTTLADGDFAVVSTVALVLVAVAVAAVVAVGAKGRRWLQNPDSYW